MQPYKVNSFACKAIAIMKSYVKNPIDVNAETIVKIEKFFNTYFVKGQMDLDERSLNSKFLESHFQI
jgi:hypothetical protein